MVCIATVMQHHASRMYDTGITLAGIHDVAMWNLICSNDSHNSKNAVKQYISSQSSMDELCVP